MYVCTYISGVRTVTQYVMSLEIKSSCVYNDRWLKVIDNAIIHLLTRYQHQIYKYRERVRETRWCLFIFTLPKVIGVPLESEELEIGAATNDSTMTKGTGVAEENPSPRVFPTYVTLFFCNLRNNSVWAQPQPPPRPGAHLNFNNCF